MTVFNTKLNFEVIRDNIADILIAESSDNNFEVVKHPVETFSAESIALKRKVYTFYDRGESPDIDNPISTNSLKFKYFFKVELVVAGISGDGDDTSSFNADREMDDLIRRVWQSIMQGSSKYLGTNLPKETAPRYGIISNRAIDNISKISIKHDGGHAIMVANMEISCQTSEDPQSISGVPISDVDISTTLGSDPSGILDENAKQGTQNPVPAP